MLVQEVSIKQDDGDELPEPNVKTCCNSERELKLESKKEQLKIKINKIHMKNIQIEEECFNRRKFQSRKNLDDFKMKKYLSDIIKGNYEKPKNYKVLNDVEMIVGFDALALDDEN